MAGSTSVVFVPKRLIKIAWRQALLSVACLWDNKCLVKYLIDNVFQMQFLQRAQDFSTPPLIMGILNVTPDSFSDGAQYIDTEAAYARAAQMLEEGADMIDIGGESTRPGAKAVSVEEELARVLPVLKKVVKLGAPVSVDTSKPQVMRAVAEEGAALINDVYALRQPGALQAVADCGLPVCLMHMQGEPRSMQKAPHYDDVVSEVSAILAERMQACLDAGIPSDRIWLDPGFGFGKTLQHNVTLLNQLHEFLALGAPLLVGISRKSMLGHITGREVDERMVASVAAAQLALSRGARILRVHDVAATRDMVKLVWAVEHQQLSES